MIILLILRIILNFLVKRRDAMITLAQAPQGRQLKVRAILGGEEMHRRLIALGFHKNDLIEVSSLGILRGPLLIKNLTSDSSFALGRGIAQKIMVEIVSDEQ